MKVTIKNIPTHILRSQFERMKFILSNHSKARTDASKVAISIQQLIKELNERGCKIGEDNLLYRVDYWRGDNIINEQNNKNPIINIDEYFNVVRKRPSIVSERRRKDIKNNVDKYLEGIHLNENSIDEEHNSKYQLKVAWTGEFKYEKQIKEFFKELGLNSPEIETYNIGGSEEHLLLYIFEGSQDGFKILKRSVSVMLNIFCEENFEIGISGKKI